MALVKCKECGKEVSNTAKVCPHCGKKAPAVEELSVKTMNIIWVISIVIVLCLYKSCFGGPKHDSEYRQCLVYCNEYHKRVGVGSLSANCYSRCSDKLEKRYKNKQDISAKEIKASNYISKFVSIYENIKNDQWSVKQHVAFFNGVDKDKILETHIGTFFLDNINKLISELENIDNSTIDNDFLIDQAPISNDFLQLISNFNQRISPLIHSESYISNLLENEIVEELNKITISEPIIRQCPGKVDYKLTNNSSFNIKYIKFGIPDFKDYRFKEFTHLREDWYYDLDRIASAPSFVFDGNNKNMTLNLVDSSIKLAPGRLSSGEQMSGTYYKAYEIMKSSVNIVKYDLHDFQQQYCFAYKKPIIREIVFAPDCMQDTNYKECSSCEPYKKRALDIYKWKDYTKTKEDKIQEDMLMLELNIPKRKVAYNQNIYHFYEKNKDVFTTDYLLHLIDKKENINMLETIKERITQIFCEKMSLDAKSLPLIIELTDNGIDFKMGNILFQNLLNTLNTREQKELAIQNFINKFKIKEK